MGSPRTSRLSYRRALLVYLLAIVAPTLVLLYLGLQSVQRQQEAIASLTLSNLRLSAHGLVRELERRAWGLAEACLRDPDVAAVRLALDDGRTPEAARGLRLLLANILERHPIAEQFFVLQGNAVRFPLLRASLPERVDAYVAREERAVGQRFAALFAEGESQEFQHQRPDRALAVYRESYELAVSDSLKALALARVARCLRKVRELDAAERAYRTLAERYGDLYDEFHRPYGVIAALERDELVTALRRPSPQPLLEVYRDLAEGRWELGAEEVDYFLARLGERVPDRSAIARDTPYLRQLGLARALQQGFRHRGPLEAGQVYAGAFTHGATSYQSYYTRLGGGDDQDTLVGFAVDLTWVERELLPLSQREVQAGDGLGLQLRVTQRADRAFEGPETRVPFSTLFPFWELSFADAHDEARQGAARHQGLIFAGSTVLILSVLVLGVLLLMRDVSRETQLNRVRSDFVSAVSHELKTPLTLIRLYGETLTYGQARPEHERRRYSEIITRESERLTHLVEKVLDFSRIERGQRQYHLEEGDLAPLIARTVDVYGQYLARRGFSVETDLAPHLPPVEFDADAVCQAVLNLLDNALKYSGESRFVAVRLRSEGERVVFEVEDRGIGIPASERDRIFEQFYRGRTENAQGGYGLGLFLVRHVMEAHGGQIEVDSETGRGTRIRLLFPVSTAAA